MGNFINKIKDYVEKLKDATKDEIVLVLLSFVVMALFNILGFGIIFSAVITLIVGLIWEILYCYSPKKTVTIFKWEINVPDIKTFINEIKSFSFTKYNDFNKGYLLFNVDGIIDYIILKIIFNLIF